MEIRSKEIILSVLIFSLITLVIFNFAFDPTPKTALYVSPGILWTAILFGGILGLNRTFAMEINDGCLYPDDGDYSLYFDGNDDHVNCGNGGTLELFTNPLDLGVA